MCQGNAEVGTVDVAIAIHVSRARARTARTPEAKNDPEVEAIHMSIAIDVARDTNITRLDAEEPRLQCRGACELCGASGTRAANAYEGVRTHRGFTTW
jgi:hypothetical protein